MEIPKLAKCEKKYKKYKFKYLISKQNTVLDPYSLAKNSVNSLRFTQSTNPLCLSWSGQNNVEVDENIKNGNYTRDKTNPIVTNDNIKLVPVVSKTNILMTFDFPEISIASVQYNEGPTGCTYIRFNNEKSTFHCDRRGGSVMTFSSDQVRSDKNNIRGICFAGGSFFGLESITGCIVEEWKANNYTHSGKCDIVGAALYSGNLDYNSIYPDKNLGRFAVNNLKLNEIYLGQAGAGCMAGDGFYGQGAAFKIYQGVKIFAFSAVNALGVIHDPNGRVVRDRWEFKLNDNKSSDPDKIYGKHTTLTAIITNLSLDGFELEQLSVQCHTNIATIIRPFNTIGDGDVLFGISLHSVNKKHIKNFNIKEFYDICSVVTNNAIEKCWN